MRADVLVPSRARGVVLFACLALLLVLGIMGTSATRTTMLELRVVRNADDALLSFQAAEAALSEAERYVVGSNGGLGAFSGGTGAFTDMGLGGLWTAAPPGEAERWALPGVWAPGSNRSRVVESNLQTIVRQPRYIVEWLATLVTRPGGDLSTWPDDDKLPNQRPLDRQDADLLFSDERTVDETFPVGMVADDGFFGDAGSERLPSADGGVADGENIGGAPPDEIMERLEIVRVTALGVGRTDAALSMVQSTYEILVRDLGGCARQPGNLVASQNQSDRLAASPDEAGCRSWPINQSISVAGIKRLSWREMPLPATAASSPSAPSARRSADTSTTTTKRGPTSPSAG